MDQNKISINDSVAPQTGNSDSLEKGVGPVLETKIAQVRNFLTRIELEYMPAAFATSLGAEDMVLTDLIGKYHRGIEIFTLDTGRLPEDTHQLMRQAAEHYNIIFRIWYPDPVSLSDYVHRNGINAFYNSEKLRKECCEIRKVQPLRRALSGKRAWLTGMRREQAITRNNIGVQEYDSQNGLHKFNPLYDWTQQDVWDYLKAFEVPYNALHDQGYVSIGCAPCTRPITPGEDVRAGRWWWEDPSGKECGLHRCNLAS